MSQIQFSLSWKNPLESSETSIILLPVGYYVAGPSGRMACHVHHFDTFSRSIATSLRHRHHHHHHYHRHKHHNYHHHKHYHQYMTITLTYILMEFFAANDLWQLTLLFASIQLVFQLVVPTVQVIVDGHYLWIWIRPRLACTRPCQTFKAFWIIAGA